MKEGDELVRLHVIQPVPARVLDEGELRVDTLADRGRGWLGEDEARHVLQLRAARAIRVPPEVGRLRGDGGHHPRALERALLRAIEGELRIDLLAEGGDGRLGRRRPPPAAPWRVSAWPWRRAPCVPPCLVVDARARRVSGSLSVTGDVACAPV